jgi:hypothetical protein
MLKGLEKQYGKDSPVLLSTLTGEANALNKLGRGEEAAKISQRAESIRSAMGQSEGPELTPHP